MYSVGAVIQRQCCRRTAVIINLHTNHVSKIDWNIGTRCLTTGNPSVETLFLKSPQLFPFSQQKRTLTKDSMSDEYDRNKDDGIPKDFKLIYVAIRGNNMLTKYFAIGTFLIIYASTLGYAALYYFGCWNIKEEVSFAGFNKILPTYKIFLIAQILLVTSMWLYKGNYISKLPVQRIYQNPNKQDYVAIFYKDLLRKEKIEFSTGDVRFIAPEEREIKKLGNATIKGKECFLYVPDFKLPTQYYEIMSSASESEKSSS